jgi:predicted RNA-binding Zn-ribbon protein involved in translation (DUF1610 family)
MYSESKDMSKRKTWKCDFEDCIEVAEWYRRVKGTPVKLCTRHYAHMGKQRMGKPVEFSQLSAHDIWILEEKEGMFDFRCPNCGFQMSVPIEEVLDEMVAIRCQKCDAIMSQV